ncbi:hypothetical protein M2418_001274 [Rhizobium sp. BIGb0125]|uniref:hypothetical protein n=1 Tax=Rhizobium sp. BIGb0125 TaxID=2940618 RepID=UPI00216A627D|nr:hypothetical protein [Rhizobium sp. BIGb0125]MCS4241763.1 hypothetical protein [Rhizobium sp. BIGb0125]
MTKTFSGAVYSSVRLALIATMLLGPIAGLAAMKENERSAMNKGAGFVLLMSLQRGALG